MTVIPLQLKPGDAAQKAGVQEQVLLMIGICTEIRRRFCPFRSAQGARGQTTGHLQKILNIAEYGERFSLLTPLIRAPVLHFCSFFSPHSLRGFSSDTPF